MRDTNEAQRIQHDMAAMRREVQSDVGEIVEDARTLTDWRYYVQTYPWQCLAAAGAIGYLLVPKRLNVSSPDAKTLRELAAKNRLVVTPKSESRAQSGIGGTLLHLLANAAMRAAVAYVGQQGGRVVRAQASGGTTEKANGERESAT